MTEQMKATEEAAGHRVEIEFRDDQIGLKLLHPSSGCEAPMWCGRCAADLTDPDAPRCYDCKHMSAEGCWLDGWFDNVAAEELLRGKITLPIEAKWEQDHPVFMVHLPGHPDKAKGGFRGEAACITQDLMSREESDVVWSRVADRLGGHTHDEAVANTPKPSGSKLPGPETKERDV